MALRFTIVALTACTALGAASSIWSSASRPLTFEERVEAQRAIERVYYSHLTGARRTFEQAVTQEVLERKVRLYLQQSAALEAVWNTPITAEMLGAEMTRIERGSQFPERLGQVSAALGWDSVLIQETLARSALAERLARSFFASDDLIHDAARAEAEEIHARLQDGTLDPETPTVRRGLLELSPVTSADPLDLQPSLVLQAVGGGGSVRLNATPGQIDEVVQRLPSPAGVPGEIEETESSFSIKVNLPSDPGQVRVASYVVPKISWDSWWAAHGAEFDPAEVEVVAEAGDFARGPIHAAPPCNQDDTWNNGMLDDLPDPRAGHQAVWTGSEMIIWGIASNASRYDPLTDTWRGLSRVGSPAQPSQGTAVWTGTLMIIWGVGGLSGGGAAGASYDPITDSWQPISAVNQPTARARQSAVWTGTEMIIWGGQGGGFLSSGARYDPATDTWSPISDLNAPSPRRDFSVVWTGTEMIVWGGQEGSLFLQSGARYNPSTDSWTPVSLTGAPIPRLDHSAVWTGTEMLVWGGSIEPTPANGQQRVTSTGGRYNPVADTWTDLTGPNVPEERTRHTAVWTGSRMIIWGGLRSPVLGFELRTGGLFDPAPSSWQATSQVNAPRGASDHTAIWTGSRMITWGGGFMTTHATGGRYDPATNSWTPTATSVGVQTTGNGPALWTGTEMLVWSIPPGWIGPGGPAVGARYDPMIDTWRVMSGVSAPAARFGHVAVWTGDEMLVWGGQDSMTYLRSGGRYDLQSDTWRPISPDSTMRLVEDASAVWTGTEMIVWGGKQDCSQALCPPSAFRDAGARYDPSYDSWRTMAPLYPQNPDRAAVNNSVVWTGHEMIVWGGCLVSNGGGNCGTGLLGTGASYDPARDAWLPLPDAFNPADQSRIGHSVVWTGRNMIIVGGSHPTFSPNFQRVLSYDSAAGTWTSIPVDAVGAQGMAPDGSAVWTGRHLIVWGGVFSGLQGGIFFGASYDSVTRIWRSTSLEGVPLGRFGHSALWTGSFMIVWGGSGRTVEALNNGGRYVFGQDADDDGDGLSECAGDCDDASAAVHPGGTEICNGRDDTCDGIVDEDLSGLDTDADGTPNACDVCPVFSNPGQNEPLVCSAVDTDGQCMQAQVMLPEPIDQGVVTVLRPRDEAPAAIIFDMNVSSCVQIDPIQMLLNGHLLVTFVEPTDTCLCVPPTYRMEVADATLLRSYWNVGGVNTLEIVKPGQTFPPGVFVGSFVGWIRARIETDDLQEVESVCLLDVDGGECTEADQCAGGSTSDAIHEVVPVPIQFADDDVLVEVPFSNSMLPSQIDLQSVPDGPADVCVGSALPPRLYAADGLGSLYVLDETTGASTPAGALPIWQLGLAHDEVSRRSFAQTANRPAETSIVEFDLVGMNLLATSQVLALPMAGLEALGGKLYGIESSFPGPRLIEMDPDSGASRALLTLPDGNWSGLAYSRDEGILYAARLRQGESSLWALDPFGRTARSLQPLTIWEPALEVGPDGLLYAIVSGVDSLLYRIDPATGNETLIGPTGIPGLVSLMTVRNQPRGCFGIVKQGEPTLAINGTCNAPVPPVAAAGADIAAECTTHAGAPVVLDGSASSDPDPGGSLYEWFEGFGTPAQTLLGTGKVLSVALQPGHHVISLRITTSASGGLSDTDELNVDVADTQPPRATALLEPVGTPGPGHAGQYIARIGAIDACAATLQMQAWLIAEGCEPEPALDGQLVEFIPTAQGCAVSSVNGARVFRARALTLRVIAGDGVENLASAQVRLEGFGSDADVDGVPDLLDCNPADAAAWSTPGEALDITVADSGLAISWGAPAQPGSTAVSYDVIAADAASGFNSAGSCIEAGTAGTVASDGSAPPPGAARFYLVRARNICPGLAGSGSVGSTSSGNVRAARACP